MNDTDPNAATGGTGGTTTERSTAEIIAQAHQNALHAQARNEVATFAAVADTAELFYRETRTWYQVRPPVDVTRGGTSWRVGLIEVARTDSVDPEDPEPYVSVRGRGRPLTAQGEVAERRREQWIDLPERLAGAFPVSTPDPETAAAVARIREEIDGRDPLGVADLLVEDVAMLLGEIGPPAPPAAQERAERAAAADAAAAAERERQRNTEQDGSGS